MNYLKRAFRYLTLHILRNPKYLFTYALNFFNPNYVPAVKYHETSQLVELLKQGKSLIRIGDGEVYIMNFGSMGYENYLPELREYFFEIIKNYTEDSNYVLGLNKIPISKTNSQLKKDNLFHCWQPMKVYWQLYFDKTLLYFDATAFYYNETIPKYFEEYLKTKELILVTNSANIEKFKNNKNIPFTDVLFVESPATHTFEKHRELTREIMSLLEGKTKEKVVVLLACGPASKVIAYQLSKEDVVSVDVGRGIEVAYTDERIDQIIYPV